MFFSLLWKLITGNLSGIFTSIASSNVAKYGAEASVDVAAIQASQQAYQERVSLMRGMWITQWLLAFALLPPIIHQGAVYLDSVPFYHIVGSWHVPSAPKPYDDREWSMICALLGIQTGLAVGISIVGTVGSWLKRI